MGWAKREQRNAREHGTGAHALVFPRTTRSDTRSAMKSSSDGPSSRDCLKLGLDEDGVARHRTCGRTGGAGSVRRRVGQRRVERAHVLAEEELGRAVHREARDEVLPVDGDALLHARGHLLQHVVRVSGWA